MSTAARFSARLQSRRTSVPDMRVVGSSGIVFTVSDHVASGLISAGIVREATPEREEEPVKAPRRTKKDA